MTELGINVEQTPTEGSDFRDATLPTRSRLPDTRHSVTHHFNISGHEGYFTVGLFEDGRPGELFIKMAKQGSTMSGLADAVGILTSLALHYGVPAEALARKFENMRFEPSGWTKDADIRHAHSVVDYIFRWVGLRFSPAYREHHNTRLSSPMATGKDVTGSGVDYLPKQNETRPL